MGGLNYQDMIRRLESYWADQGCVLMQPYHTELGAGTMNPATFLRCLGPKPWKAAYVEPSIRPSDGRYGENPFRFQQFLQYLVVIKPAPPEDRKSTRLNSSHTVISYAVFCLKKKKK